LPENATVTDLLAVLDLTHKTVAVELNGDALVTSEHPRVTLHAGDKIEIVRAAAGG